MKKLLRVLPWILVVILTAAIGLIVFVYMYTYTGVVSERVFIPNLFFGGRVAALSADLERYGIRDLSKQKTNFPLERFEIIYPRAIGEKQIAWEWRYSVDAQSFDLELEADQFEQPLRNYCDALQDEMNIAAGNKTQFPAQFKRRSTEDSQAVLFVCNLADTSQLGFYVFLRETDSQAVEGKLNIEVSLDSQVREG